MVVPFLALLGHSARARKPLLLSLWAFSYLALPTVRNRIGPVSVYWSDLVALAVLVAFVNRASPESERARPQAFYALLLGTLSIGLISAFVRYGVLVEPGFILLRFATALLPLVVVPRIFQDPAAARAILKGVTVAAVLVTVLALVQTISRPLAIRLEELLYGDFPSTVGYRGGLIDEPSQLRSHAVFGSPTVFAGAAVIMGLLILMLSRFARVRWLPLVPLIGCGLSLLLTYSRHGLLAALLAVIVATITNRRSAVRRIGAVLIVATLLSTVVSTGFWAERFSRGIAGDVNVRTRLVDGPSELADRLREDPMVGVAGIGLGVEHVTSSSTELGEIRRGFVSNTFLLYMLYAGVFAFAAVVVVFGLSIARARRLALHDRSLALAALLGICSVLAADNYGFFHMTIPFGWSIVVAMVYATRAPNERPPTGARDTEPARPDPLAQAVGTEPTAARFL
jgi:hypothetical protein